jgi:hypothetical protein
MIRVAETSHGSDGNAAVFKSGVGDTDVLVDRLIGLAFRRPAAQSASSLARAGFEIDLLG